MTNEKYLDSIGIYQFDIRPKFLEVMAAYGQNRWWLSADAGERAYYQSEDEFQILPLSQYAKDLSVLLGRKVSVGEIHTVDYKEISDAYIAAL